MSACPACHADTDPDAELCTSCGEPLELGPPMRPSLPPPLPAIRPPRIPVPTLAATPKAKRRVEEPEAVRCPGCGSPTKAARCPGCGAKLRSED